MTLPGDNPFVAVVAEIDPPLLTGLRMFSRSLVGPFGFTSPSFELGLPAIDRTFVVRLHDPERALRILARPGERLEFALALREAGSRNALVIDDRTVSSLVPTPHSNEREVAADIDLVTSLARRFAERVPSLPERPEEHEARESWTRTAAGWSLEFDAARWKINGEHEGRKIDVVLEGLPPSVAT